MIFSHIQWYRHAIRSSSFNDCWLGGGLQGYFSSPAAWFAWFAWFVRPPSGVILEEQILDPAFHQHEKLNLAEFYLEPVSLYSQHFVGQLKYFHSHMSEHRFKLRNHRFSLRRNRVCKLYKEHIGSLNFVPLDYFQFLLRVVLRLIEHLVKRFQVKHDLLVVSLEGEQSEEGLSFQNFIAFVYEIFHDLASLLVSFKTACYALFLVSQLFQVSKVLLWNRTCYWLEGKRIKLSQTLGTFSKVSPVCYDS